MEEALIKLLKVACRDMKLFYQFGCDAETTVSRILADAELAVHPEARQDLIEYIKTLN
jgi:hypothetical protein